ncbi:MAG: Sec-independent protein translocase TatB, partial [Campylobacterales bacterium]
DKLPSAMVEIAKFFRNAKRTIGDVKDTLEHEMHVSEIKEEALAYKKELLDTKESIKKSTDISHIGASLTNLNDDILGDDLAVEEKKEQTQKVTFEKKKKGEDKNV